MDEVVVAVEAGMRRRRDRRDDDDDDRYRPMRARQLERELIRAGAVFVKSESSHKVYLAPDGRRKFHLCAHGPHDLLGKLQVAAAWQAMREAGEGSE